MSKYIWVLIAASSLVLLLVAFYGIYIIDDFMNTALEQSESSMTTSDLHEGALGTLRIYMTASILHGIWFAIFGFFTTYSLRNQESFGWKLGLLWSIVVLFHGIGAALSQVYMLNWSTLCPMTITTLAVGMISLIALLVVRKDFT